LTMIDFDLPPVEIDLQQRAGATRQVGRQQKRGLTIVASPTQAFVVRRGRDDEQAQRAAGGPVAPMEGADLFVANRAPLPAVAHLGALPRARLVLTHLLRGERRRIVEAPGPR